LQSIHRCQAMSWSSPPSHMTPCHVSYVMSSSIWQLVELCNEFKPLHHHALSCSD
jgi:hypothetical protein